MSFIFTHPPEDILVFLPHTRRYTRTQKDDTPLYVFDAEVYGDKIGKEVMTQYSVPKMFGEDLFQLVEGEPGYPSYR